MAGLVFLPVSRTCHRASIVSTIMSMAARTFWKSYWIALQRSARDKRARSYALKASFLLIYVVAYVLFIGYTASDGWNGAFYTFIFGSGTIAAILMRRWHRKQDELLNFSLTGQSRLHPQDASAVSPEVRTYLARGTRAGRGVSPGSWRQ